MNPFISIVIISWNIERELPRTIRSFSPGFQRDVRNDEYEIIVVDNGSDKLPDVTDLEQYGADVTVMKSGHASISPVEAVNIGLNASSGKYVGVFIDGARLASPGLIVRAREALCLHPRAVVATRGRYLGYKAQRESVKEGYDSVAEDALLEKANWLADGYSLFDISIFDESSGATWFDPIAESNGIFMSRSMWSELGGFDERFQGLGGGLVNIDTWIRASTLPEAVPVILLGEATFHQVHGGVMTNQGSDERFEELHAEYREIRGKRFEVPPCPLFFWGIFAKPPPLHELLGVEVGTRISTLEAEKAAALQQLQHYDELLSSVQTSKSWILTAPLRFLAAKFRG